MKFLRRASRGNNIAPGGDSITGEKVPVDAIPTYFKSKSRTSRGSNVFQINNGGAARFILVCRVIETHSPGVGRLKLNEILPGKSARARVTYV